MKLRIRKKKIVENNKPLNEDLANDSSLLNDFVDLFYTVDTAKVKAELDEIKKLGKSLIGGKIVLSTELKDSSGNILSSLPSLGNAVNAAGQIGEQLVNRAFKKYKLVNRVDGNIKNGTFPDYIGKSGLYLDYKFIHKGAGNATLASLINANDNRVQDLSIQQEFINYFKGNRSQIDHIKTLLFIVSYEESNEEKDAHYVKITNVEIIPLIFTFGYKDGKFSNKSDKSQQLAMRVWYRQKDYEGKEKGLIEYINNIASDLAERNPEMKFTWNRKKNF